MILKQLCKAADIDCPVGSETLEICSISSDSREKNERGIFVCLRGRQNDGHAFIEEAIQNGAVCILTDRSEAEIVEQGVLHLRTQSTRAALAYLFDAWYGFPSQRLKIVGVTGTNGKTSVAHMLHTIFENSLHPCGMIGTVGSQSGGEVLTHCSHPTSANLTTPDPADLYRILDQMVQGGAEYVVMEVSSHALELEKLAPLHFEAAIFTNLTPEHLDFHKSMEAYAKAKEKLMRQAKFAVINVDSPYGAQMCQAAQKHVTCAVNAAVADYHAEDVTLEGQNGVGYRLCSRRTGLRISCPIAGEFTVMNSMQAAVCALELGCSAASIKTALATMGGIKGRMERVKLGIGADFAVIIDYAHTPDALETLLKSARRLKKRDGRLVVLFGCGGDRDCTKRSVMGEIASRLADEVIVTSDNCRSEEPMQIIQEILSGVHKECSVTVIPDRTDAIRYAVQNGKKGDLILIAGKGHEEYEVVKGEKRPFHERTIIQEAFGARNCTESNGTLTKGEQTDEDSI